MAPFKRWVLLPIVALLIGACSNKNLSAPHEVSLGSRIEGLSKVEWPGAPFQTCIGKDKTQLWSEIRSKWNPRIDHPTIMYDGSWEITNLGPGLLDAWFGFDDLGHVSMIYCKCGYDNIDGPGRFGVTGHTWFLLDKPAFFMQKGAPADLYESAKAAGTWGHTSDAGDLLPFFAEAQCGTLRIRVACGISCSSTFDIQSVFEPNSSSMKTTYTLKPNPGQPVFRAFIIAPQAWMDDASRVGGLFSTNESDLKWVGLLADLGFREGAIERLPPSIVGAQH